MYIDLKYLNLANGQNFRLSFDHDFDSIRFERCLTIDDDGAAISAWFHLARRHTVKFPAQNILVGASGSRRPQHVDFQIV